MKEEEEEEEGEEEEEEGEEEEEEKAISEASVGRGLKNFPYSKNICLTEI